MVCSSLLIMWKDWNNKVVRYLTKMVNGEIQVLCILLHVFHKRACQKNRYEAVWRYSGQWRLYWLRNIVESLVVSRNDLWCYHHLLLGLNFFCLRPCLYLPIRIWLWLRQNDRCWWFVILNFAVPDTLIIVSKKWCTKINSGKYA